MSEIGGIVDPPVRPVRFSVGITLTENAGGRFEGVLAIQIGEGVQKLAATFALALKDDPRGGVRMELLHRESTAAKLTAWHLASLRDALAAGEEDPSTVPQEILDACFITSLVSRQLHLLIGPVDSELMGSWRVAATQEETTVADVMIVQPFETDDGACIGALLRFCGFTR